jgi:serine/threonine protein phosphatase 1
MATIAIGDIHGRLPPLVDLLSQLTEVVTEDDAVVFLGDYIDRGPDSRSCLDAILSFRAECPGLVVGLRGNHEDWLLRTVADDSRHSWLLGMEGITTIRSYSPEAADVLRVAVQEQGPRLLLGRCRLPYHVFLDAMPPAHRDFLSTLSLCFDGRDCLCSHAGLDPGVERLQDQPPEVLLWGHDRFPADYRGEAPITYGHWDNAQLDAAGWPRPAIVGNTIGVDTISHGVLTAVRFPDRRVFQSARYAPPDGGGA